MIRYRRLATVVFSLSVAVLATGCGKKPEPLPPAPVPEAQSAQPVDRGAADRAAAEAEAARLRALEEARRTRATIEEMVFFDFDRSEVRPDARTVLDQKRPILRDMPAVRMRIEGHADERGSTEYNLALGMRRAQSVKQYLVDFGLDPSRFEITSFGEERPLATGSNESAWSRNRRAEFVITAGLPITATDPAPGSR